MQRFPALLLALGLLFTAGACDLAEINENPNAPTFVPENLQLSGLLANFSYQVIGNEPARTPNLWMQQIATNGTPLTADNYDVRATDVNNMWEFFSYTDVMNNARILNEQATENGNYAYSAIAKTILAWNLGIVTDLWGSAPWTEAFDPSNTTPAYDEQQVIYASIYELLEGAIADYDQSSRQTPGSDDLLYGGDMQRWERLTHTLLARFHMHLTEAPGNDAATRAQQALDALEGGFQSNADDADFQYYDAQGAENPWYQWTIDGKWTTTEQMAQHYIDLLKTREDPRLAVQARQVGAVTSAGPDASFVPEPFDAEDYDLNDGTYVGHQNGLSGSSTPQVSSIGSFYSAPGAPLNWISYAEAKFIEAEATLIVDGAAAADPIFRDAIAASMDKLGIAASARDAYIASRPALSTTNALEELMTEKYVANFLSLEVYNDWRRTGFPELEPVSNRPQTPNGIIPLRYPYPQSERNTNVESVEATGIPAGFSALERPVWWDTTN